MAHIIMITHGDRNFIRRTLDPLLWTRGEMTLTVVANAPSDGLRDYLADIEPFLDQLITNDENLGRAGGGNIAWRTGDADHTVFVDDDMLAMDKNWLNRLVDIADDCPQVGLVGHSVEPVDWRIEEIEGRSGSMHRVQVNPKGLVGGACVLIPRRTYEACGRHDEELIPYGEADALYCWKVSLAGMRCVYVDHSESGRAFRHLDGGDDPEYRAWKDMKRRRAIKIRDQLYQKYRAGTRPLNFSQ